MEAATEWFGQGLLWGASFAILLHMSAVKLVAWLRWFGELK